MKSFKHLLIKVAGLVGVISLDEASAAKRKREKPSSISDFVAYSQGPIEPNNMGKINALHADFHGTLDAKKQAINNRFDQEDLKQLMNIKKCLIAQLAKKL